MNGEKLSKYQERKAAIAALERMHEAPAAGVHPNDAAAMDAVARRKGKRPLKPPPVAIAPARMTAGAAELAREIRRGTYTPRSGAFLVDIKSHDAGRA